MTCFPTLIKPNESLKKFLRIISEVRNISRFRIYVVQKSILFLDTAVEYVDTELKNELPLK